VSVSALACCATGGGSLRNRLRVAFYHGVGRRFVVLGHGSPLLLVGLVARASRLHAAEHAQRDAIRAACDAGASPRQIATEAVLSPEDVRRIGRADPEFPYLVTVERRAVSPLRTQLLVRAATHQAAGELASRIAERARGGMFEATRVRRAARKVSAFPSQAYDDAGLD
jgi:hypothetical protein